MKSSSPVVAPHPPTGPRRAEHRGEDARPHAGGFVVVVSRGGIIDENARAEALRSGHLGGGAAIDTFVKDRRPRITRSSARRR
jgi:D-isomer specific 2-hydroxyacid dehydrogenase, NAD binding domain